MILPHLTQNLLEILIRQLNDVDIHFIDYTALEGLAQEIKEVNVDSPVFRYINICLLETSRDRFVEMLENIKKDDDINILIEKEEYEHIKDLLTLAFRKGFRSPGQAIGVFMDIVDNNSDQIER